MVTKYSIALQTVDDRQWTMGISRAPSLSPSSVVHRPSPVETIIYLVRHGLTEWNRERRFQGHLDVPLSVEGRAQAHRLAAWLARQPVSFTALYSSDLARAAETATTIGHTLGLHPRLSPALREIF